MTDFRAPQKLRCTSPATTRRAPLDTRGVSLLELVVVMGIIGMLMALVLPVLSAQHADRRLHAFTRKAAADIRYARQKAMMETWSVQWSPTDPGPAAADPSYAIVACANRRGACGRDTAAAISGAQILKQVPDPAQCGKGADRQYLETFCDIASWVERDGAATRVIFNADGRLVDENGDPVDKVELQFRIQDQRVRFGNPPGQRIIIHGLTGAIETEPYDTDY